MAGSKLVASMLVGAQPIGLRGDPLHTLQGQIRAVVRRRLGERHYHLLAEPQPHSHSGRVDWYSELAGEVRPLRQLGEAERSQARADIDSLLADIDRLGATLEARKAEDARLAGRFLRLAAQPPADECCYRVGDQPLVIGWGYEVRAVTDVAAKAASVPAAVAVEKAPEPSLPPPLAIEPLVAVVPRTPFPWLAALVGGLALFFIGLGTSWAVCQFVLEQRVVQVIAPPPPPPPPPVVFDPIPGLRSALDALETEQGRLRATLASLREELSSKLGQCKPPDLPEDRWKKRDLAVLEGCWVLGREVGAAKRRTGMPDLQGVTTAAKLCFSRDGRGTYDISNRFSDTGEERCSGPVTASFDSDAVVLIKYGNLPCRLTNGTPSGNWLADTQTCRRLDDSQAQCTSGQFKVQSEFRRDSTRR